MVLARNPSLPGALGIKAMALVEARRFAEARDLLRALALREGKEEPSRVIVGMAGRRAPIEERHRGTFVAGVASAVPVRTDAWGFQSKRTRSDATRR